jgi:phosphatidylglycerophosphatase C
LTTRTVAAFDFDGTLTRRDSMLPFLARVRGWPRTLLALAAIAPQYAGVVLGRVDRDATKDQLLTRVLRGTTRADLAAAGAAYGEALVRDAITPEMRAVVASHRARGHDVVIVSASLEPYLETVAERLDAQAVLCTKLEFDADDRATGRMEGGNCRGAGKAERLREHLGDEPVVLWAYGDSDGDREMFAMADHVVRARRGRVKDDA